MAVGAMRPGVRRVLSNTAWLSGEQVARLATGLVVTVLITRYLGPSQFGLYSFALALVAIAGSLSAFAADTVVVRELVIRGETRAQVLGSQFLLRTMGSGLAFVLIVIATGWQQGGINESGLIVILAASSLLFSPFESIATWFQSEQRARPVVSAKLGAFLVATSIRLLLVWLSAPLIAFAALIGAEAALSAMALTAVYRWSGGRLFEWRVSRRLVASLFSDSWPLLLAGVSGMLYMRIDIVMLNVIQSEHETGIYGAATRLSEAWHFVPMALMNALQPVLLRAKRDNRELFMSRMNTLYVSTAWISMMVALCISIIAMPLVTLLFGDQYRDAGPVLALHVWAGVAVYLGVASSQYLVAENLMRISMYRTMMGLGVNVLLNLLLIPSHGAYGAAAATVVSYFVATFSLVVFDSTRSQAALMVRAFNPIQAVRFLRYPRSLWVH